MISTWLTEQFGLSTPVVSAPMAGVSGGALASAVSGAGGLGMIGVGAEPAAWVAEQLDVVSATGRPFGIGFLAWLLQRKDEVLDVALERSPGLVAISYGDYEPYVERIHAAGALAATHVGTLEDTHRALDAGIDVVVARGGEGGGHGRDLVATLPLLQAVLDTVDVPVLAAGGIATARGVAAVIAAGAAGAWVGTAFIACDEAQWSGETRDRVVEATLTDTLYTTVLDIGRGHPWPAEFGGRAIRNEFATAWHGREDELRAAGTRSDEPVVWAGQAAGLVRSRRPAAEVVADLAEAENVLAQACRTLSS